MGDLSASVEERHLDEAFSHFGAIETSRIIFGKPYGFVKFESAESARRAIEGMNGQLLRGTPVRVSPAKVPSQNRGPPKSSQGNWDGYDSRAPPRGHLDVLPDRDSLQQHFDQQEYYGHLGNDDSIAERTLVSYDDL